MGIGSLFASKTLLVIDGLCSCIYS